VRGATRVSTLAGMAEVCKLDKTMVECANSVDMGATNASSSAISAPRSLQEEQR
jgi:hypothetical protein